MQSSETHPSDQAQLKQDAKWSLASPPLIGETHDGFPNASWFQNLQIVNPQPIWPAPEDWSRFRLGVQFERLWHRAIESLADYELVAHNLQVHDGERTLGEFDALVRYADQLEHWEFAVKFYLGTGDLSESHNWFGPNPQDRLDLKLAHMQLHQMQLGNTPAGRKTVLSCAAQDIDSTRGIMKGRLFYPLLSEAEMGKRSPQAYPACVNPDHLSGWWLPIEAFLSRFSGLNLRFRTLEKRHWLAPLARSVYSQCLSAEEYLAQLTNENEHYAHAIAVIDSDGNELSRGFLVKPAWFAATGY